MIHHEQDHHEDPAGSDTQPATIVLAPCSHAALRDALRHELDSGAFEPDELSPVGYLLPAIAARVDELRTLLPAGSTIILHRDWEGIPGAYVPGTWIRHPVLTFASDGRVAFYDRNLPEYHPNAAVLLGIDPADDRATAAADAEALRRATAPTVDTCPECGERYDFPDFVFGDWEWDEQRNRPGALYPAKVTGRWSAGCTFSADPATVARIAAAQHRLKAGTDVSWSETDDLRMEDGVLVHVPGISPEGNSPSGIEERYHPCPGCGIFHGLGFGWVWSVLGDMPEEDRATYATHVDPDGTMHPVDPVPALPTAERVADVIDAAEDSYWQTIADAFPGMAGDIGPGEVDAFQRESARLAARFVAYNVDGPTGDHGDDERDALVREVARILRDRDGRDA